MLQPLPQSQRPRTTNVSVPPPVGGLNTRDSIDAMAPEDAILLDNWFPTTGKITLREGYASHATGVGSGDVKTLIEHHAGDTRKLLAIGSNGTLYDATSAGSSPSSLKTGLSSAIAQTAEFDGNTIFVTGADTPFKFNGSSASDLSITLSDSSSVTTLDGVHVFKNRVYYWRGTDQQFYYSATVNTLEGNFTLFPLNRVGNFGGDLLMVTTLTQDGGEGIDDLIAFVMTSGEVIVYSGSDPSSATDFALVGTFRIAEPVPHIRAAIKLGGDVAVVTKEGIIAMSSVFRSATVAQKAQALSEKIRGSFIDQVATTGTTAGWELFLSPNGDKMFCNYPTGNTANPHEQFVFNPVVGAWCRFTGINSFTWGKFNGDVYFGGAGGVVYKFSSDSASDAGSVIQADCRTAFNYFGDRNRIKQFASVQPFLESEGTLTISTALSTDFDNNFVAFATSTFDSSGATWNVAAWNEEEWAGSVSRTRPRLATAALGYAASMRLKVSTSTQTVSWLSASYGIKPGGPI